MHTYLHLWKITATALAMLSVTSVYAGRPLAVDDANVNDAGTGHIEAYYQRQSGSTNTWTVSPAYGITEGVEIAAAFNRDNTAAVNTTSVQVKLRLTESKKSGCNFGASLGLAQTNVAGTGNSTFANGLMTCNLDESGSVHVNLGLVSPPTGPNTGVWGIAYEREFGALTGHVELFGAENALPTVQFGLRTMLTKRLQLDGTVGRSNDEAIYSLGFKFLF
jgi:hypothetical protein